MTTFKTWIFGLMITVALAAQVRGATVTATLDPTEISLGDSTQLTVTVSGSTSRPVVPRIDGLEIQAGTESTSFSFSMSTGGGTTNTSEVITTYTVTPQREGSFVIPALEAGGAKSTPLTLRVGAGPSGVAQVPAAPGAPSMAQSPAVPQGNGPVVMPPNNLSPTPQPGPSPLEQGKYGSIEIALPKKEFYEGELAPVEIRVLISAEVRPNISSLPQFTSDGFTLNSLGDKPEQTEEDINGHPYYVLTWHSALTAVKSGHFTLNLSMPITVVVPQRMPDMNDPDQIDSMFRNMFSMMQGEKKQVNLTGTSEPLKVLSLPQEGRPADFSGAVGQFEAEASASPTRVNAGDPVTLTYSITGHGNFDRVSSDLLPNDANWKTYSAKIRFDAQDGVGYAGSKTFEQPIIPTNGSVAQVPSLSFSYFDPEKRQYQTCTTAPIPLAVAGAPAVPAPAPVVASAVNSPAPANTPPVTTAAQTAPDLRMNRIEPGDSVATLEPVYTSALFLAGQALPLVAFLGGVAFLRHRRRESQPERARLTAAQQAIRQQVAAMDTAMQQQQAGPFFVHARNALQQRFGQRWNMRPEAITVSDIDARLGDDGGNARAVFELADQAVYSDLNVPDADLQQWREVVVGELAETT